MSWDLNDGSMPYIIIIIIIITSAPSLFNQSQYPYISSVIDLPNSLVISAGPSTHSILVSHSSTIGILKSQSSIRDVLTLHNSPYGILSSYRSTHTIPTLHSNILSIDT